MSSFVSELVRRPKAEFTAALQRCIRPKIQDGRRKKKGQKGLSFTWFDSRAEARESNRVNHNDQLVYVVYRNDIVKDCLPAICSKEEKTRKLGWGERHFFITVKRAVF